MDSEYSDTENDPLLSREQRDTPHNQYAHLPKPISLLLVFRSKFILTVEPVLFLFLFGIYLQTAVLQRYTFNRYGQEAFIEELNYTDSFNFCMSAQILDLNIRNGTNKMVTQKANYLSLFIGITGQVSGIVASLICGPLSDKFGRKPVMIVIASASSISAVLIQLLMYFEWSIEVLVWINTVNGLAGGLPGMLTVVFAYMADVSSERWRTLRFSIMEAMMFIGGALGLLSSGEWSTISNCHFNELIFLYLGLNLAALLYIALWLPESLTSTQRKERAQKQSFLKRALSGFRPFVRKNYCRWKLWLGLIAVFCGGFAAIGVGDLASYFLLGHQYYPLSWDSGWIGHYQALVQGVHSLSLLFFLPILVALNVPDPVSMILGFVWLFTFNLATWFTQKTWELFMIGVLRGAEVIGYPVVWSIMSKTVLPRDQGGLFSIVSTVQALSSASATVAFYFFLSWITTDQDWPARYIFFFIAANSVIHWPIAIIFLLFGKTTPTERVASFEEIKDDSQVIWKDQSNMSACSSSPLGSNALYFGSTPPLENTYSGDKNANEWFTGRINN